MDNAKIDQAVEPLFESGIVRCRACIEGKTGSRKICYACRHELTGKVKENSWFDDDDQIDYDGEDGVEVEDRWHCQCETWECRCVERPLAWCPICEHRFNTSEYLAEVFADDPRTQWLANMVTHYRHEHRAWDRNLDNLRCYGESTYERQKAIVNEQAKRQIIRKASDFLIAHGVGVEHFRALKGTTEQTIELALKKLPVE